MFMDRSVQKYNYETLIWSIWIHVPMCILKEQIPAGLTSSPRISPILLVFHQTAVLCTFSTTEVRNMVNSKRSSHISFYLSPLTLTIVGIIDTFQQYLCTFPNSILVHSLMLSSHLFFCLPLLLAPFTVSCRIVFAMPEDLEMWPYHLSSVSSPWLDHHALHLPGQLHSGFCCEPPRSSPWSL